ncbi:PREDICTED: protein ECT2-like [Acropora digitifera]|uniref:protein ECT2-like n=1 Tax=Acropora digitifera TaxID=70779 RepID=UPI00077A6FAA|nr:PREDICTED: protein ECT2-like [Acropora digitifera]
MEADNSGNLDASDHQTSREGSNSSAIETRLCVVGKENGENKNLMEAIQALNMQTIVTDNVKETMQTAADDIEIAFICDPFEGENFELLRKEEQRIIGPPIVYACAQQKQPLPYNSRPIYCSVMSNHILCFTGFRKKEELGRLCNLVHHMGGSIRREFSGRVTQLVANSIHGQKYRAAVSLGTMIMTGEWVTKCWERRHELGANAMDEGMEKYKMMPFHGCYLSFHGFSDEEKKHMEESTEQQGGVPVEASDARCTHLVVEDSVQELPSSLVEQAAFQAVKQENELELLLNDWKEDKCIGNIISSRAEDLVKVYPPFINYFEMTKETVARCDRELPRFHAFLKACLSRPECGRQSLAELLIRPVQRLPSMNLLLTDLLKHTDKKNPDHTALGQAVDSLKNIMTHINEDKRKTEGQVQMFEILRDVDNCPAYVLSSHRVYVSKVDTFELSDTICGKGQAVTIFLFNDSLEVTKRRGMKMMNNVSLPMKSPATGTPKKAYKHVKFMPLSHVRRVVDIRDNSDTQNLFGIIYRCSQELKEKLLMFRLIGEEISKEEWLQKLTMGLANTACTADTENFLTSVDAEELMLTKSDMSNGTLFRAIRVAKRTKKKVSRALSMNKTPKKAPILRRTTSSVSPSTRQVAKASPLMPSALLNQMPRPRATSVPAAELMSP